MPFVRIRLKALKPKPYFGEPTTFGEHLRKRRLELGLTLKAAAKLLGVTDSTLINWEQGETEPIVRYHPAILRFLGYDPFPEPMTVPERLLRKRREMGWTIDEAAGSVDVDPSTWSDWEAGELILYHRHRALVATLLGLEQRELIHTMRTRWNVKHGQAK